MYEGDSRMSKNSVADRVQTERPGPTGEENFEIDPRVLPFLRQEGETRPEKDARLHRTKEMLHDRVISEIGIKSKNLLTNFDKGRK